MKIKNKKCREKIKDKKILIDVGNTNTSIAVMRGKKIIKRFFIHTSRKDISPASFRRLLGRYLSRNADILVVSVVPRFLSVLKLALKKIAPAASIGVVGVDVKVPIRNLYKEPKQVGQDRLVASFAARELFGSPVIVIDFGTAVTVDYVNGKGEYEGGFIFPGLRLALKTMSDNAALLPKIWLKKAAGSIGKDTRSSMNNGILYGYAAMCDGLIERLLRNNNKKAKIVATGGDARIVAGYTRHVRKICPELIFEGLKRIVNSEQ